MEKVYIDVNIFLNPVLYDVKKNQEAKSSKILLQKVVKKEISAITSVLTWDEFVWITKRILGKDVAIEKGKEFLLFPNLMFKRVSLKTIKRAQDMISKYNIRPRDAIHVACAIENNIKKIYSFDKVFDNIEEIERVEP